MSLQLHIRFSLIGMLSVIDARILQRDSLSIKSPQHIYPMQ
jgi:hypothetical protein